MAWDVREPLPGKSPSQTDDIIRSDKQHISNRLGGFVNDSSLGRVYQVGGELIVANNAEYSGGTWQRVNPALPSSAFNVSTRRPLSGTGDLSWGLGAFFGRTGSNPDSAVSRWFVAPDVAAPGSSVGLSTTETTVASVVVPGGRLSGGEVVVPIFNVLSSTTTSVNHTFRIYVNNSMIFNYTTSSLTTLYTFLEVICFAGNNTLYVDAVNNLFTGPSGPVTRNGGFNTVNVPYSSDITIDFRMLLSSGTGTATSYVESLFVWG